MLETVEVVTVATVVVVVAVVMVAAEVETQTGVHSLLPLLRSPLYV